MAHPRRRCGIGYALPRLRITSSNTPPPSSSSAPTASGSPMLAPVEASCPLAPTAGGAGAGCGAGGTAEDELLGDVGGVCLSQILVFSLMVLLNLLSSA